VDNDEAQKQLDRDTPNLRLIGVGLIFVSLMLWQMLLGVLCSDLPCERREELQIFCLAACSAAPLTTLSGMMLLFRTKFSLRTFLGIILASGLLMSLASIRLKLV